MRIDISVHADNATEFKQALQTVVDSFPTSMFDAPRRGFGIVVTPEFSETPFSTATLPPELVQAADPPPAPTRRGRKPAAAPVSKVEPEAEPEAEDTLTVTEPQPEGEVEQQISPAEAKNKSLDVLRKCYDPKFFPAGAAGVKEIQTKYGIKKFQDVPDDRGHELLADAEALHAKVTSAAVEC